MTSLEEILKQVNEYKNECIKKSKRINVHTFVNIELSDRYYITTVSLYEKYTMECVAKLHNFTSTEIEEYFDAYKKTNAYLYVVDNKRGLYVDSETCSKNCPTLKIAHSKDCPV